MKTENFRFFYETLADYSKTPCFAKKKIELFLTAIIEEASTHVANTLLRIYAFITSLNSENIF